MAEKKDDHTAQSLASKIAKALLKMKPTEKASQSKGKRKDAGRT
jgi:hypothetical protein